MAKIMGILILFLVLSSAMADATHPYQEAGACKGNIGALTKNCADYVKIPGPPIPPSATCCKAIQDSDIPCICKKYVTPKIEKLISMSKLVYVAAKCDRPFAHKSKCGSYTVPAEV